jgi:predicted DNA-binding transcriptional regulator AlpA
MTISDLEAVLNITKKTIYQGVYHNRIPCIKINKKTLRFDPKAIAEWLESKSRPAVEKEPKQPVRRSPGRPRKNNGRAKDDYINSLVEQAKKEVLV